MTGADGTLDDVAAELRGARKLLLTTHELPDGDSLGSALALCRAATGRGVDAVCFVSGDQELPGELGYLRPVEVVRALPADAGERLAVAMDCGTLERIGAPIRERVARLVNVDHHHDNQRYGDVNWIDTQAAATAEMVFALLGRLDLPLTRAVAEPLYAGLVTDTGRFSYDNTTASAHRVAAALIEAGVEPQPVFRRIYENMRPEKLALLGRAIDRLRLLDGGHVAVSALTADDFAETGATDHDAEGIIDSMRALADIRACGLMRDAGEPGLWRVSLRGTDPRYDVSAFARSQGGGGHKQAAGFTGRTDLDALGTALVAVARA